MQGSKRVDGRFGSSAVDRRCIDPMRTDHRVLKKTIELLRFQLSRERDTVLRERAELQMIQEANTHLLHATFGAQDQKDMVESINSRQTVFLSMLAHELRNPIAAISVANSLMISAKTGSPKVEKMANIIGRQTMHLQRLVEDLLDVARISTGKVSLKTTQLLLHDVVNSTLELCTPMLSQRSQRVTVSMPSAPMTLDGDLVRLSQLLSNLIINASKFSMPHSMIEITAIKRDEWLSVSITDHGIGIALEDQGRIFDLFTQAKVTSEFEPTNGLGIGLALVKSIAELHGGWVMVASDGINCGSSFTVVLPLSRAATTLRNCRINNEFIS